MAVSISTLCISCGACVDTCPHDALFLGDTQAEVIPDKCIECGECIEVCPTNAITLPEGVIKTITAEPVVEQKAVTTEERTEKVESEVQTAQVVEKPTANLPESEYQGVWIYIEQRNGTIAPVSLELLGEGRKLADKLGVELAGVLLGDNVKHLTKTLYEYGADAVYLMDDPTLDQYRSEAYYVGIVEFVRQYKPEILLFGATAIGRDLASTVATELGTGLTADTTRLDIDLKNRLLEASRPAMGGNIMATILCKTQRPQMASVRPKVFKAIHPIEGRTGKLIEGTVKIKESDLSTKVISLALDISDKIRLSDADIIVAGGKGLGDEKGFNLIHELADVLGAAVGASRDAVEAGWATHSQQVGQTGTTVAPKLYFAIGISGAVQHTVGMENSEVVVAINKDPNAQIFEKCNYAIVGDAFEVVPKFIEEFKKLKQGGERKHG
ncbi:FAD-binding protein [Tepidibacillus marianensis]|uniref:FAD-binding protein n=1 Tax=Tepidibacillus marianensis TaxID=3131995 RepID=UPI0030D10A26